MVRRTSLLAAAVAAALAARANASAPPPVQTWPTVSLSCYSDGQNCEATASGGSGQGYTFDWNWPAQETWDDSGYSTPNVVCYPAWGWFTISVNVTDSNGHTGSASTQLFCPP
jgi:hypothetical protein